MIELPKDADGREIPLDTKTLYDEYGRPIKVSAFSYSSDFSKWLVQGWYNAAEMATSPSKCYLTAPDSWEKLEDDLGEAGDARYYEACAYFHRDKDEDGCVSCPGGEDGCGRIAMRDILDRIRKLRGEDR